MALPQNVKLEAYQGDTFAHEFSVLDENGDPFILTGWSITAQIRQITDDSLVATFAVESRNDAAGTFVLRLDRSVTTILSGRYMYDVQLSDPVDTYTVVRGALEVDREVTE